MCWKRGREGFRHSKYHRLAVSVQSGIVGLTASAAILMALACHGWAGEFHTEGQVCSECHTAHFSQHGRPPEGAEPGGPFEKLLLFSSPTKLCLSCHDGSDVNAPDVVAPVSTSYSPDEFSAGGFFEFSGGAPSEKGHDLGFLPAEVPFSGMAPQVLKCTSCHDPHGNANYRNLRDRPGIGSGTAVTHNNPPLPTDDVFERVHPDGANPSEVYKLTNIGYRSAMSKWCAECHDRLLPNETGTPPAHFRAHPSEVNISGFGGHVDLQHWLNGTGAGFGAATGDGIPGIPRVRFQNPSASSYETARTVSLNNQIFCGTCHLAHGSRYATATTWPYKSPVNTADAYAPCQQCHNQ